MLPVASCAHSFVLLPVTSFCKKMDAKEFFEDHKLECLLAVGAGFMALLNVGDIRSYMAANTQLRQSVAQQQARLNEQLAAKASREQFEELANLRYDGYCEAVFNLTQDGVYTALTPGQPVIKGDFVEYFRANPEALKSIKPGHVLPAGTPVCDAYGNSSELVLDEAGELPVIGEIASTSDLVRIENFITDNGGSKELSAM